MAEEEEEEEPQEDSEDQEEGSVSSEPSSPSSRLSGSASSSSGSDSGSASSSHDLDSILNSKNILLQHIPDPVPMALTVKPKTAKELCFAKAEGFRRENAGVRKVILSKPSPSAQSVFKVLMTIVRDAGVTLQADNVQEVWDIFKDRRAATVHANDLDVFIAFRKEKGEFFRYRFCVLFFSPCSPQFPC